MPSPQSERRLHPVSFVFRLAALLRQLILPGLFVLFAGARGGETWQIWIMVLFLPLALVSIAQALAFRYRLDPDELAIQSGLIFRQQRHVPYERIQNIDAIQNVLHRALGVTEVRLETAGGQEPEARLTVVSQAAFEELRAVVLAARGQVSRRTEETPPPEPSTELLHLPARELMICGLVQGRGLIVIGALFGLLWETGLFDRISAALFGDTLVGRGILRRLARAVFVEGVAPWRTLALAVAAFAVLLVVTRLFSIGWSLVRLYGFRLRKSGDDLRADFGLFTRVTATIPIRRVQSVSVHEGPFHRIFGRVSVRVETAGGESDEAVRLQREWLAPVIRPADVPRLLRQVLPSVDAERLAWRPVDPRGVRRMRIRWLVRAAVLALLFAPLLGWSSPLAFGGLMLVGELDARRSVRALGWGVTDTAVFFRSGWIRRVQSIAPFSKIQAVTTQESPFDRRLGMATVAVDTAGGSVGSSQIDVPFLAGTVARSFAAHLAAQAARTTFRW